jgi:hypothetical protein
MNDNLMPMPIREPSQEGELEVGAEPGASGDFDISNFLRKFESGIRSITAF